MAGTERFIYNYAAVIGIDGMGNFNRFASTPNLDSFFEDGAVNELALSMNPTISAENRAAMLLGASPIVHGLTNSALKYYSNGVRGACGEFGLTGSAKTSDITIGKNSFSLSVWLKVEPSINEECVVCSTKPWWWQKRSSTGFSLVVKKSDTVLCIANGNDDLSLITPFPEDFAGGWINALFTVDKQKKEIGVWYDFRFIRSFPMDEAFCGETVANVFSIGNDTENDNNNRAFPNIFRMDDLLLFDGALSSEDIASLGDYYGKGR